MDGMATILSYNIFFRQPKQDYKSQQNKTKVSIKSTEYGDEEIKAYNKDVQISL
jgi:hypothetical protein